MSRTGTCSSENREAVLAALQEGRCDGILPAARSFLDGFAEFCLRAGVLKVFEAFPDHRARRSIPMFFFCNTLVHRPLWRTRLQPIQDTLFRSPYILRQLGFNARQIDAGFYTTAAETKPFTAEAIADAFVRARRGLPGEPASGAGKPVGLLSGTVPVGAGRWTACTSGCRAGAHAGTGLQSVCAGRVAGQRGLAHHCGCWWRQTEAEITVGRKLVAAAEAVIGVGSIRHLLVDRGYLDGAWLSELHARGTRVTIGVREDMRIMEDMIQPEPRAPAAVGGGGSAADPHRDPAQA